MAHQELIIAVAAVGRAFSTTDLSGLPPELLELVRGMLKAADGPDDVEALCTAGAVLQGWYMHGCRAGSDKMSPDLLQPMHSLQIAYQRAYAVGLA